MLSFTSEVTLKKQQQIFASARQVGNEFRGKS